jgi:hypothetical protein
MTDCVQTAMDLGPGLEPQEELIQHRRALPITNCQLCKREILQPWLSGSHDDGDAVWFSGRRLKLDPHGIPDGTYFLINKTAHRRRPEDLHPSLVFYVEHDCIAESKP